MSFFFFNNVKHFKYCCFLFIYLNGNIGKLCGCAQTLKNILLLQNKLGCMDPNCSLLIGLCVVSVSLDWIFTSIMLPSRRVIIICL